MAFKLTIADLPDICRRIAEKFNPDRIILFGSQAYGTAHEGSDFDLLIIMPFVGKSFRKALEIYRWLDNPYPLDLIVRTPEDTHKRYAEFDPLIREALDKGRVLYEQHS